MIEYERVELEKESELEDKIKRAPHLIEGGLRFVDSQRKAGRGPLDLLLVDSNNTLIVAELKIVEDEEMLMQAIDYFDYVNTHLESLARIHREFNIDPKQTPRLMLIAPSFSQKLINRCKWISEDVRIDLYIYQYITLKGEHKGETIVFSPVNIPPRREQVEERPSMMEQLNWISDTNTRELAKNFLDEVVKIDPKNISISNRKWGLSIKTRGTVIASWYPRMREKWFVVGTYDPDGEWRSHKIRNKEESENCLKLVKDEYNATIEG